MRVHVHVHVPVWEREYFTLPVTELSAHHQSVGICPAVVTHCPPLTTVENF